MTKQKIKIHIIISMMIVISVITVIFPIDTLKPVNAFDDLGNYDGMYYFANHDEHSYLDVDATDWFYGHPIEIYDYTNSFGGYNFENCIVIIDIKFYQYTKEDGMTLDRNEVYEQMDDLEFLLNSIKSNHRDCFLILINDLVETRIPQAHKKMLTYPDYHINTDILTTFVYSMFKKMEELMINDSSVIILNDILSQDWFYRDYLNHYFKGYYLLSGTDESDLNNKICDAIQNDHKIRFAIPDESVPYYNSITWNYSQNENLYYHNIRWICSVCDTGGNLENWIEYINSVFASYPNISNKLFFSYNENNVDLQIGNYLLFEAAKNLQNNIEDFIPYAIDHINIMYGHNMEAITNYQGICDWSYKIGIDDDGWLQLLSECNGTEAYFELDYITEYD